MNSAAAYELRERLRAVLDKHGLLDNVQLEFDIMGVFTQPTPAENGKDCRQATLDALAAGMTKGAQVEADWTRLFKTTPNWNTKTADELKQWIKRRAEHGETLDRFADWWYANDWRGKQGSPPAVNVVREQWGLAFSEDGGQPHGEQRAYPLPEGL